MEFDLGVSYLRVYDDTDVFAVFDHFLEIIFDALLSECVGPFLAGLGECLFLALVPELFYIDGTMLFLVFYLHPFCESPL